MMAMDTPSLAPILSVEHLTVQRGNCIAIENVSFSLMAGSNMAIIGPNGAGKSTLIQAILGLLPHHQGAVTLLGQRLTRQSRGTRSGRLQPLRCKEEVAYLPQNFLVDVRIPMTVQEFVGLGWDRLTLQLPWTEGQQRRRAVQDALAHVEALHLSRQSLSSLSGGETKRVLLAYCLVRPRKLLILDEAPAGLDIAAEADFYALLNHLKQEQGWSILQISHNLKRVRQHCDCVLCLNRRLLRQGSPAEVLNGETMAAAYGDIEMIRRKAQEP